MNSLWLRAGEDRRGRSGAAGGLKTNHSCGICFSKNRKGEVVSGEFRGRMSPIIESTQTSPDPCLWPLPSQAEEFTIFHLRLSCNLPSISPL